MPPAASSRRRWRIELLVIALLLVAGAYGARWLDRRTTLRPTPLTATCVPNRQPTTVAEINAMIASYRQLPGFVGADVGASAPLQGDRSLWVFGDTLRAADFHGQKFVRNSMLLFSPRCVSQLLPPGHGAVIPDRKDGVGYWPMSVAVVHYPGYDLVGVSAQRVRQTGPGFFDFTVLGPAVAELKVPVGKAPELLGVRDVLPDDASRRRPMWGAALAVRRIGPVPWVYIYGTANPEKPLVFGWSLHLARARISDLTYPSHWQYWDGHRWQRFANRAAALIPAAGGVSEVLSVFEKDGSWYAVSKRDEVFGTDLVVWKAPAPTGPFVAYPPVARIPSNTAAGVLQYMPLAHPDLLPRPGHVVVSYSRNVTNIDRIHDNPELYRPKFLEIPLP